MRTLSLAALLTLLLAGCISGQPHAALPSPQQSTAVLDAAGFVPVQFGQAAFSEQDLGKDAAGNVLHADVYLPAHPLNASAPSKFPAILLESPYWAGGTGGKPVGYMPYDFAVLRLLPRGYAVVFGDLGGEGGSAGCWDFMGPKERASAVAMVEAIAKQPWSDGKVGMLGLSYDAMTQVMAASDAAPHLVTVVPSSALTEAYKGLYMNGVSYGGGWHSTMAGYEAASVQGPGANAARTGGWLATLQQSPACLADNSVNGAPTGADGPYWQARDFRALAKNVKASVFVTQGFFDPAVKPDNFGAWFQNVPTLKKAWLGFWFHQYPTAANAGRDDLYLTLNRWFDHTLKGVDNGIDREPAIDVQDSTGAWRHEASWPPADAVPVTLTSSGDGTLGTLTEAKAGALPFGGPMAATELAAGKGGGALRLATQPLDADLHIAGRPVVNLTLTPQGAAGEVVARLYDGPRMVSQGAFNLLYAGGLDAPRPLTPGQSVRVGFELYPTDWVVPAGHALTLELNTVDGQTWFDSDAPAASVSLQAGPGSTLALPAVHRDAAAPFLLSCGKALKADVPSCFKDRKDQGVPQS
ncbi:MAG: uncharacterized protein QOI63_2008 [Thermoplasmata archaeon]|jgi:predicted acyl esterase|nr:uncharacterized protein [Thermoplasmata archaeon]